MKRLLKGTLAAQVALASTFPVGCAPGDGTEEIDQVSQTALTVPGITYWVVGTPIPVCFSKASVVPSCMSGTCNNNGASCVVDGDCRQSFTTTEYNAAKTAVLNALAASWGSVGSIEFTNRGECSSLSPLSLSMSLKLTLQYSNWGGTCGYGLGASCTFGALPGIRDYIAVHEVGHALGFGHAHWDTTEALCDSQLEACLTCVDAKRCSVKDYNDCFKPQPPLSVPATPGASAEIQLSEDEVALAEQSIYNWIGGDFESLTLHDPESVMNYCAEQSVAKTSWVLTEYDKLGGEILFPNDAPLPIGCKSGCFYTASGLLLRSNGALQDSWLARGAYAWWSSFYPPQWWRNQTYLGSGEAISLDSVADGLYSITFESVVSYTGESISGASSVEKSDSKWTAIFMSIL